MNKLNLTLLMIISSSLLSCNDNSASSDISNTTATASAHSVSKQVLATIDGVTIEQSQLDSLLINMFGEYKATQMDTRSRQRALDSMLASYALAHEAKEQLPKKQIIAIQEKTRRHHENLLINAYMQTKMNASALSSEKIKTYYEKNIEKFSSGSVKEYQLLTTKKELEEESRNQYLEIISKNTKKIKLVDIKKSLEEQNFEMQLHAGVLDKKLLSPRLFAFIDSQSLNEVSDITFIDGKPYFVVLTSIKTSTAKPLVEVRDVIRKSLVLEQLKQAIKEQSAVALEKSDVVYRDR